MGWEFGISSGYFIFMVCWMEIGGGGELGIVLVREGLDKLGGWVWGLRSLGFLVGVLGTSRWPGGGLYLLGVVGR